ncbi:hypothetical protein N431DRAFT_432346 [Stipitochalara longipes BDJ]|nr:hypothetical protein N431DRAFT_432346 [Stipitochalara longipes BDJ]
MALPHHSMSASRSGAVVRLVFGLDHYAGQQIIPAAERHPLLPSNRDGRPPGSPLPFPPSRASDSGRENSVAAFMHSNVQNKAVRTTQFALTKATLLLAKTRQILRPAMIRVACCPSAAQCKDDPSPLLRSWIFREGASEMAKSALATGFIPVAVETLGGHRTLRKRGAKKQDGHTPPSIAASTSLGHARCTLPPF